MILVMLVLYAMIMFVLISDGGVSVTEAVAWGCGVAVLVAVVWVTFAPILEALEVMIMRGGAQ